MFIHLSVDVSFRAFVNELFDYALFMDAFLLLAAKGKMKQKT